MATTFSTPRYNAEDFETASIRSVAPSYISEVPSYHSHSTIGETIPAYAPRTNPSYTSQARPALPRSGSLLQPAQSAQQQAGGLPPVLNVPRNIVPSIQNYNYTAWSANDGPASKLYRSVAERRVSDGYYVGDFIRRPSALEERGEPEVRPLEDPYLVGEVAAAEARRERLARESGDDILIQEDRQWDWLLAQMADWDQRERSWNKFRREVQGTSLGQRRLGFGRRGTR